ncbi:hypothetical protein POM88_018451 [Heracleum sosnowskyi]|uniref:KIB1-4 beta-propeller domain-containing protein n=1 Tax=Heracleum sosnowskyi TaxID=360622 RepID=A0AAD8N0D5_9APIA|nr:hypothetical protein POM88_018451 [Heracleum sosnowskyi]
MILFSLYCLVKIFRFFNGNVFVCRYQSLPETEEEVINQVISLPEAKDDNKVSWSQLDSNLLGEIMCRLASPTDQARFRAVCQTWLAVEPTAAPALLPWFVGYNRSVVCFTGTLEMLLYEPSSTFDPTSVDKISLTKLGIPSPPSFDDNGATCINNWLFFCIRQPITRLSCYRRNFVLYSPLTKEVIKLPQSDYPFPYIFSRTFSTDPKSPDCVFLISDGRCLDSQKIVILTYRNGDEQWTARKFNRVEQFVPCSICFSIYFQGMFYIVTALGQIASYNSDNGEFRLKNVQVDDEFEVNYSCELQYEVFEFNGYLTLIYFGSRHETHNNNFPGNPCIKRFDWSNNVWIPMRSLGDETLFVGKQFHAVGTFKARHNEVVPNKIYYFSASGCMIYSVENDGALVEHEFITSNFPNRNTTNYYLASGGDSHGSTWLGHLLGLGQYSWITIFFWLKPPNVMSS